MTDETQQNIFIREMDKRFEQLCEELDLDYYFLIGYLRRLEHRLQVDFDAVEEDEANEDNNNHE